MKMVTMGDQITTLETHSVYTHGIYCCGVTLVPFVLDY